MNRLLAALLVASCATPAPGTPDAESGDADTVETADANDAPDASDAPDAADASDAFDASEPDAGDLIDAGGPIDAGFVPAPAAACAVRTMDVLFSGNLPPNPYGANVIDMADSCTASRHDVIILLGCPAQSDGRAAPCQIARVEIAMVLHEQGYGDEFIVTGAAVHNQYVEADTLSALLVERGISLDHIHREPLAEHTDENLYYSAKMMQAAGWKSAIVVSQDPGQLIMTALCDANCCVDLGRLTVLDFPFGQGTKRLGHYVLYPDATEVSSAECDQIEKPLKLMCQNQSSRRACAGNLQLP